MLSGAERNVQAGVTNMHAGAVSTLTNIPSHARARGGPPTNTQVLSLASGSTINLSPGAGEVYAARRLTVLGTDRGRWQSAGEVARYTEVAPVIERSGQSCRVRWRYFCPKFLRQSFHEYAGESIKHSFWARAYYDGERAKGKQHQAAVRSLAFKWIRIIYQCWKTRTAYDEVKYLERLRKQGSSLLNYAANNPA